MKEYTAKFDRANLDKVVERIEVRTTFGIEVMLVAASPLTACCLPTIPQDIPMPTLPAEVAQAFDTAYENIRRFHAAQQTEALTVETMPGVVCKRVSRPIGE